MHVGGMVRASRCVPPARTRLLRRDRSQQLDDDQHEDDRDQDADEAAGHGCSNGVGDNDSTLTGGEGPTPRHLVLMALKRAIEQDFTPAGGDWPAAGRSQRWALADATAHVKEELAAGDGAGYTAPSAACPDVVSW